MKSIRMKAQMTIMASFILVLAMALICTSIRSTVDSVVIVKANMAANMGIESAFANYSRTLADQYDILLVPSTDGFYSDMLAMVNRNCQNGQMGKVEAEKICPIREVSPIDDGGNPFATEIIEYMKYGLFSDFAQMLLDRDKEIKKEKIAGEIITEIEDCEKEALEIEEEILRLTKVIDGLDVTKTGFVSYGGQPTVTNEGFLKRLCPGQVTNKSLCINDGRVYKAVNENCKNVIDVLEDIKSDAKWLDDIDDEDDVSAYEISNVEASLQRNVGEFMELTQDAQYYCEVGISTSQEYLDSKGRLEKKAIKIDGDIKTNKSELGEDLSRALGEDVAKIKQFDMTDAMCDPLNMQIKLKNLLPFYDDLCECANGMNEELDNYQGVMDSSDYALSLVNKIHFDQLEFDYSQVKFESDKRGEKILTELKNKIKNGFLGLVIDDVSKISNKRVDIYDLATIWENEGTSKNEGVISQIRNVILYDEYISDKFGCFTKKADEDSLLDYQIEYVLNGKNTDFDNLFYTALELSGLREGTNFCSLFLDRERKEECKVMSIGLFGFTGIPALVVVGQYAIMAAWAYGESVLEVRQILSGEKVPIIKNSSNWKLSLSNLLLLKLEDESNEKSGLNYEQYLSILLLLKKNTTKYFRTMALMEMWMISQGNEKYRMCDQIYEVEAELTFQISAYGRPYYYAKKVKYNY